MGIAAGNSFNVRDFAPALWLDAADSSTLFDATVGGNLVADGGAVARWEDKSGNGRHATQSTLASRPLRAVGAQNTRDVLRFDGTNDTMTCPVLPTSATDFSVVIVGRHAAKTWTGNSNTELQAYIEMPHLTTRGWVFQTRPDQGTNRFQFSANPTSGSIGIIRDVLPNQYNVLVGTRIQNGADSFSVNGVNQTNSNTTAWVFQNSPLNIGSWNSNRFLQGDILEIMIFSYVLSTAQRQSIERYLANKWGLGFNPLSLSPALWLDASDSSTLFDATVGGNLVAAGGAVARWEDKSGNGRHITQSTLANRPIRSVSSLGGRDTLFFDGVNDFMSSISLPASQVVHWLGVFIPQSKAAYHNIYDGSPMLWLQATNRLEMNAAYTIGLNVSPAAYINQSIICSIRSSWAIAPGSRMRVNGTIVAQNPALVGSFNVTRNISMFNRSNSQTFSGNFAEQLWFTTDLSNADVIAIERYLAQKWNITN